MPKNIAITGLAAAMLGCLPAYAQQAVPELDGAPGYRAEQEAAKRATAPKKVAPPVTPKQAQTAPDKLKTEQAKLAQQAEAQKAEQARLARAAEDLKAQQARLDARAAALAAEEKRLAQLRIDQESQQAAKMAELAELNRQRDEAAREEALRSERQAADLSPDALPDTPPEAPRPTYARLDFGAAQRSCTLAGEDEALARDFYSARYDSAPRFYQGRGWELRGRMRLEDRRGYLLVDTVCELDADSEAQHFAFLR